jgi:hypothetical protein
VVGRLMGCCGFLGRGPFFSLGRDHAERISWFVGLFVCTLLFFEKGVFPGYSGTLMAVPDTWQGGGGPRNRERGGGAARQQGWIWRREAELATMKVWETGGTWSW